MGFSLGKSHIAQSVPALPFLWDLLPFLQYKCCPNNLPPYLIFLRLRHALSSYSLLTLPANSLAHPCLGPQVIVVKDREKVACLNALSQSFIETLPGANHNKYDRLGCLRNLVDNSILSSLIGQRVLAKSLELSS